MYIYRSGGKYSNHIQGHRSRAAKLSDYQWEKSNHSRYYY